MRNEPSLRQNYKASSTPNCPWLAPPPSLCLSLRLSLACCLWIRSVAGCLFVCLFVCVAHCHVPVEKIPGSCVQIFEPLEFPSRSFGEKKGRRQGSPGKGAKRFRRAVAIQPQPNAKHWRVETGPTPPPNQQALLLPPTTTTCSSDTYTVTNTYGRTKKETEGYSNSIVVHRLPCHEYEHLSSRWRHVTCLQHHCVAAAAPSGQERTGYDQNEERVPCRNGRKGI